MHSSRSLLALVLVVAGCGDDKRLECVDSAVTYQTFGDPFITNWCRGCHSEGLYPTMRQDAPVDVNFDTLDEVRAHKRRIYEMTVATDEMPPNGGPSDEERALLREWLSCGAN